jgi:hypothetical protein
MSVEFEQNNEFSGIIKNRQRGSGGFSMINFLIKSGWVKDTNQASVFLIGTIIISLLLTVFIFYNFVFGGSIIPEKVNPSTKVIQGYVKQGYTGEALFNKIIEARKSGLIK